MTLVLKANKVVEGCPSEASLEGGQIVIGRLPSNHIVLEGEDIEPIHAMIEVDEVSGEIRLLDMASDEGILVNGQRVDVVSVIQKGDRIQIGEVSLSLEEENEDEFKKRSFVATEDDAIDGAGGYEDPASQGYMEAQRSQIDAQNAFYEPEPANEPSEDDVQESRGDDEGTVVEQAAEAQQDVTKLRQPVSRAAPAEKSRPQPSTSQVRSRSAVAVGAESDARRPRSTSKETASAAKPAENLFAPGKERPGGSTLEVVAFWDNSILDVRHYGGRVKPGENERPEEVILGNEEQGHLIGVGPKANTRNYLLARVQGSKTKVFLNGEMKAKVRRSSRVEKIAGPGKFEVSYKEMAIVKHGPLQYFLKNVSLPNPVLRLFQDADGRPIIFVYAFLLYALMVGGIMMMPPTSEKDVYDEEIWAQVLTFRTPTPAPKKVEPPPPKPVVEVEKPKVVEPPKATPAPIVADKKPTVDKEAKPSPTVVPKAVPQKVTKALETPKKVTPNVSAVDSSTSQNARGQTPNAKEKYLGRKTSSNQQGNSGSKAGGTSGAFASARKGNTNTDQMGVEGGKPNVMSGINLKQLGAGIGAVSDMGGVGAIATGLKSQAGGAGAGSGSSAKSSGFGGLGSGSSLNTGGVGRALDGLGGGAGGAGAGGLGDPSGRGAGAGRRIEAQAVVVPQGDPAIEGALTKEEIDAVIKQNLAQIRACYERNLQGNRGLAGRVKVAFVIMSSGRVQSANIVTSDLNNSATEGCIASVIRRWKFPLPRGGGVVNVNYPFVFTPR